MPATPFLQRTSLSAASSAAIAEPAEDAHLECHVNLCNRGDAPALIRLFIDDANTPSNADYLEYDVTLLPKQSLVRGPFVVPETFAIYARSDVAGVNAVAMGKEYAA